MCCLVFKNIQFLENNELFFLPKIRLWLVVKRYIYAYTGCPRSTWLAFIFETVEKVWYLCDSYSRVGFEIMLSKLYHFLVIQISNFFSLKCFYGQYFSKCQCKDLGTLEKFRFCIFFFSINFILTLQIFNVLTRHVKLTLFVIRNMHLEQTVSKI